MPRYVLGDKFWEVSIDDAVVTTCSGTARRRGPQLPREYPDAIAAKRGYDELVAARESAGYTLEAERIAPGTTGARNEALEAAIRATPDAIEPYLVYADWLQARGDPRGELITLQHAMRSQADPAEFARFKPYEEALRTRYASVWLGERLAGLAIKWPHAFRFDWAMGFVDVAVLGSRADAVEDGVTVGELLRDLLASPCGWLVRVLTIEGSIDELRAAFALLPTVRLRHVILRQQSALEDEVKRELAPEIMTMLNHNVDVDIGFWAPEKLRWKR